jgi:hypothetical protein
MIILYKFVLVTIVALQINYFSFLFQSLRKIAILVEYPYIAGKAT